MLKYKGTYFHTFTLFFRKYLKEQYGPGVTGKAIRGSKAIYKDMLNKVDDIGADNPMAACIYLCFVLLAIWKAADGAIDIESYRAVIGKFMKSPAAVRVGGGFDINKPKDLQKAKDKFRDMKDWADSHPKYRDKTWDFNFDESKHRDGIYYHFTRCPLEAFARKYGYLEVLPVCCETDYLMAEATHAVLHRESTLATGGSICDYWIVPDKIKNPQ